MSDKIDDGSWHTDGMFEEGYEATDDELDDMFRRAGAHIALFFKWSLKHGISDEFDEELHKEAKAVCAGTMSATQFIQNNMDWKLCLSDMHESIREFAQNYYSPFRGLYSRDVGRATGDLDYGWVEQDISFDRFAAMVDKRHKEFLDLGAAAVKTPSLLGRLIGKKSTSPLEWRP